MSYWIWRNEGPIYWVMVLAWIALIVTIGVLAQR